ncbi:MULTISPECIES: YHS domain-containing (seleno)protein [unclassified Phaeobacter]|uniref:YHS domain-containing (seleno)protein n=1 Tax=Phaeobacter TaxID=302485 RepID=UPI0030C97D91
MTFSTAIICRSWRACAQPVLGASAELVAGWLAGWLAGLVVGGAASRSDAKAGSRLAALCLGALITLAAAMLTATPARAEVALVSAPRGLAVGGHDVVAFFQDGAAIPGQQDHAILWRGAIWRFASSQNQEEFERNPRAFAPRFGGYCAYALSQGYLAPGNPTLWVIADGRLYLLNNPSALAAWEAERLRLIADAEQQWPAVLRK